MEPVVSNVERALLGQLDNPSSALVKRVTENNQILLHNFKIETRRLCACGLMGCEREFAITLIPNQALYPKFCEEHRTTHRRRIFLERLLRSRPDAGVGQFWPVRIFSAP